MKKMGIKLLIVVVFFGLVGCASVSNMMAGDEGKPDVFCRVIKEPDPALMGSWKCMFERHLEEGGTETDPTEYRLIKYEDKYALHFYRISRNGKKKYIGWRDWTIDGAQIISDTGVTIFTKEGGVFFRWQDEKPVQMTRVDR